MLKRGPNARDLSPKTWCWLAIFS